MKNFILVIAAAFVCLSSNAVFSQCKTLKDKKDVYTGKQELVVQSNSLFKIGYKTKFELSAIDTTLYLSITIGDLNIFTVREKQNLLLRTSTHICELPCTNTVIASSSEYGWMSTITYSISKEKLKKLLSSDFYSMRVNTTDYRKDYEFRSKDSNNLKETIQCFMDKIQ